MCERGAVTPDVSCTAEHQSTTIASHQSTISHQAQYNVNVMLDYICYSSGEVWRLEMWCCCAYFAVLYILVCINIS